MGTGCYLAPLRLLALEVQEEMRESGVDCGLITGEEEDLSQSNSHISSTVEKVNIHRVVDLAVIDECQMIADHQRGYAWTRAILGCPAREIHCCVAPEGLEIVKEVIEYAECVYEVIEHERLVPLNYLYQEVPLTMAQEGDAFVTFSRREVLQIAQILNQQGIPASVIYGALPYKARKLQMAQFLSGQTKVIVATDAIGMGLNLPIKRVIFAQGEKYDGIRTRNLTIAEVKQIGGRAGRFGKYPEGFVGATSLDINIWDQFHGTPPSHKEARLGFSEDILEIDYPLQDILKSWEETPTPKPFIKTSVSRHIDLLDMIEKTTVKLNKEDLYKSMNIPFPEDSDELFEQFVSYFKRLQRERKKEIPDMKSLPFPSLTKQSKREALMICETYNKKLDLYYSFSAMFHFEYDKDKLNWAKEEISMEINTLLMEDTRVREKMKQKKKEKLEKNKKTIKE